MDERETETPTPAGVPPALARLWEGGGAPASRPGPKPRISQDQVVDAAVRIADREGLAAVSMKRVADVLGFSTMALYRHVESKDMLVLAMSDAAYGPPPPIDPAAGWRPALEEWATAQIDRYLAHPWLAHVLGGTPPMTPLAVQWMETGLAALAETPLDPGERLAVLLALATSVLGSVRIMVDQVQETSTAEYAATLARLFGPETHPRLHEVIAAGAFEDSPADAGTEVAEDFAFGLALTLDGVAALMARRGGGSPA